MGGQEARPNRREAPARRDAVTKNELETLLDCSAAAALDARTRIEAAVDSGELPVWLLEVCNEWERAAMLYGAARAQLQGGATAPGYGLPAMAGWLPSRERAAAVDKITKN